MSPGISVTGCGCACPPAHQPHDEGVRDPQRRSGQPGQRLLPRFGVQQAGLEQARQAEGKERGQAEGDDEPDVEQIGRDEPVQAVCHRQAAQQRGDERGQHHPPPGAAADAEPQGRQQRTGRGHHRHLGHPGAVFPARVAHGHDQRPEDRREEIPPLIREHAHDDQQPQHDREDGASAQAKSLPVNLEYFRQLGHDSSFIRVAALAALAGGHPSDPFVPSGARRPGDQLQLPPRPPVRSKRAQGPDPGSAR